MYLDNKSETKLFHQAAQVVEAARASTSTNSGCEWIQIWMRTGKNRIRSEFHPLTSRLMDCCEKSDGSFQNAHKSLNSSTHKTSSINFECLWSDIWRVVPPQCVQLLGQLAERLICFSSELRPFERRYSRNNPTATMLAASSQGVRRANIYRIVHQTCPILRPMN